MKRATAKLVADYGDDLVRYKVKCPACGCVIYYDAFISSRVDLIDCDDCEKMIDIRYE